MPKEPDVKQAATVPKTLPLATICAIMEENTEQIHRITKRAGIEAVSHGVYPAAKTLLAVKNYFKARATDISSEHKADLARKARNEADMSDIDLAEKKGLLMFKADAVQLWSDERIAFRRALMDCKTIPEKLKPEFVKLLQSVKLNDK